MYMPFFIAPDHIGHSSTYTFECKFHDNETIFLNNREQAADRSLITTDCTDYAGDMLTNKNAHDPFLFPEEKEY